MERTLGLGRVAVVDHGESARRVLRAVRELGRAGAVVAVHDPRDRPGRFIREADESIEATGGPEELLRASRAESAWLGPASSAERLAFAEACQHLGVRHLGPPLEALRRLAAPGGLDRLAGQLGVERGTLADAPPGHHLVEVVVARDARGGAWALGVGDASLRLGELTLLAECPSPALTPAGDGLARDLGVRAAAAAGWVGVAAVQLLVDPHTRRWALAGLEPFAESAPAVEALSGTDLVGLALRLAAGDVLEEAPAPLHGHAFAARLAARAPGEEAARPGRVLLLRLPSGLGVRADAALDEGERAPPGRGVLATLVSRGATRLEALGRLERALAEADVLLRGSGSNKAWLLALCATPAVRAGEAGLGEVAALAAGAPLVAPRPEAALLAAAVEAYETELDLERARFLAEARRGRPRVGPSSGRAIELRHAGARHRFQVLQIAPRLYQVAPQGGGPVEVRVDRLGRLERRLAWAGQRARVLLASDGLDQVLQVDGVPHRVAREPAGLVVSPMPAVVVAIAVEPGQEVAAGEPLARLESMKVETQITSPEAGVVREVLVAVNGQVDAGAPLLRLEPLRSGAEPTAPALALPPPPPAPAGARERWVAALHQLRRLLLGFDVAAADARRLAAGWRELAAAAPAADPEVLELEEEALRAFADLQSLYSRVRPPAADGGKPPLEELWRYLHEPEAGGGGLSTAFVALLERALAHYGATLESTGRALSLALLRLQKGHERADEQVAPILGLLERRLAEHPPRGLAGEGARALLERLVALGDERFPPLADLAREVRYRRLDQPALEEARRAAYAQAEADVARLPAACGDPAERERLITRLVEASQAMATLLVSRMATAAPAPRAALVETLLRRFYRVRPLGKVAIREADGQPCATADYQRNGEEFRVAVTCAPADGAAAAAARLARLQAEVPAGRELVAELYLWRDAAAEPDDALVEPLRAAVAAAGFLPGLRRVSVMVTLPAEGLGARSQRHFTFRPEPGGALAEDRRYRGVHPMLFERMQLQRLARFELTQLPAVEDVYLFHARAQANPKDERLFAMAEVRDVTAVRDASGRLTQLPAFERMFHEALAGMRRFQARRPPGQRLEWNRILLTVSPPLPVTREEAERVAERLAPAAAGAGLEMALVDARLPDPATGELRQTLLRVIARDGQGVALRWDEPTDRPLEPMGEYQQKVVQLRRRGLVHPFELLRMWAPAEPHAGIPRGEFLEYDLDERQRLVPVHRGPGQNTANVVVGVVKSFTERYPEGMQRVVVLGDPGREMGSVAEPECRRIAAALDLAEQLGVPLEWFEVCAGAKISMTTGTENMDWVSRVLRRIIEFTQGGGEIDVVVMGITVGAQPYWNAEATMLMHTKGVLIMAPGSSMVLTGKQALEYSGSVSAEDNEGIGGYDRIMGPNGQAQYQARSVPEALQLLLRHHEHAYRAPGERFPRQARTGDPRDRDVRPYPHGPEGGAGFETVGDVFSQEKNPDRKKPFEIRRVMAAVSDQDHPPLERWKDLRGGDTAVVWDAHLGGWPVCLVGIQSRPLPRLEFVPADGPEVWSAGTLFPQSSKKIARAVSSASGNRPLVVLANLSGFDGSPESMRRLQLEYGAEIGRAVVNFQGPIVFCVVSRYHGGAFVVFAKTLREEMEIAAVEGARASVIGGAPAAAVVFAREVETRTRKDPRVAEAERAAQAGGAARARLAEVVARVRSEKLGEVGEEFDRVHSVERALEVGSLDRIIAARDLRPYLVGAVERGMARAAAGPAGPPATPPSR
ncbi:carboxyl transferase domain-containing protein [Anaeromyxobacter diazotrophicus]|nr:carboxyl transferase domain-containing protein [Anaeromyxobacter diazotrophicus]